MNDEVSVTPTLVGSVRLYVTADGRLLSQQQFETHRHRFQLVSQLEPVRAVVLLP